MFGLSVFTHPGFTTPLADLGKMLAGNPVDTGSAAHVATATGQPAPAGRTPESAATESQLYALATGRTQIPPEAATPYANLLASQLGLLDLLQARAPDVPAPVFLQALLSQAGIGA